MANSTLLSLFQTTLQGMGVAGSGNPTTVIGNTNQDVVQTLALVNAAGGELMRQYEWQQAVKQYPGLIDAVMAACTEARHRYHEELRRDGGDHMGIPTSELARIGVFPDSYGLEANRAAIGMIIHYCYEQGLIRRLYAPEELFLESNV